MGKLLQGILGGVSGKVGNVIGSSWKGIPVIKARPLSVANPRTALQVAQRGKMANCVSFSQQILTTIIKPLWDRFAQQQSGFNAFISRNIALFESELPSPPSELKISVGKMAAAQGLVITAAAGVKEVEIEWDNDSGEGLKLDSDEAYLLVINSNNKEMVVSSADVVRSDQYVTVNFETQLQAGDVLHAYLAFRRADGTVVSDTAYSSETVA